MVEWFKNFVTDKSAFEIAIRTAGVAVAGAAEAGMIPLNAKYAWIPALVAVLFSPGKATREAKP